MRQFIVGLMLGVGIMGGLVYAQQNFYEMTPFERQNWQRNKAVQDNLNMFLLQQQQEIQRRQFAPHPFSPC